MHDCNFGHSIFKAGPKFLKKSQDKR